MTCFSMPLLLSVVNAMLAGCTVALNVILTLCFDTFERFDCAIIMMLRAFFGISSAWSAPTLRVLKGIRVVGDSKLLTHLWLLTHLTLLDENPMIKDAFSAVLALIGAAPRLSQRYSPVRHDVPEMD
jgi:hypothetical protein